MTSKEEQALHVILKILIERWNPLKIILFGSRGKGRAKPYADFDLAVIAERPISTREWLQVKSEIEEKIFPYALDLVLWDRLDPDFREIILETGRIVYEKERAPLCTEEIEVSSQDPGRGCQNSKK